VLSEVLRQNQERQSQIHKIIRLDNMNNTVLIQRRHTAPMSMLQHVQRNIKNHPWHAGLATTKYNDDNT